MLVLENLHWVDHSTIDLISALARRCAPGQLMLVVTKRPVDVVIPDHPLKAFKQDLLLHRLRREITLEPLAEAEVSEFFAAKSSEGRVPEGLAKLVYFHSEGNPLFMVAAPDHMTERALLSLGSGAWKLRVPLEEIALEVPQKTAEDDRSADRPLARSSRPCAALVLRMSIPRIAVWPRKKNMRVILS